MPDSFSTEDLPPPERYQEFINEIELRGVRLLSCRAESQGVLHESMQASYELDVESSFRRMNQGFEAIQDCTVSVFIVEDEEEVPVGEIQVVYGFAYSSSYEDDQYESDAYLHIFQQVSLPVNAWPFIRQFIHDMTQRMNWPPLMLPLLKPDADAPATDEVGSEVPDFG